MKTTHAANTALPANGESVQTLNEAVTERELRKIQALELKSEEAKRKQKRKDAAGSSLYASGLDDSSIPEAMTFEPTLEQFLDPLKYIQEISAEAHRYGIRRDPNPEPKMVKILPPLEWRNQRRAQALPHFEMIPGETLRFNSKRISMAQRKVLRTSKAGESGIIFTVKVENDFQSFDLKAFEAMRDIKKRKQTFNASGEKMEAAFWDHLLNSDAFSVQYASDVPGSATTEADGLWDLSTLANMSYLRSIRADGGVDICGVNTPMMYLGQAMSPFAMHYEDNALFSINVLYQGAPKLWYGVPGKHGGEVEQLITKTREQMLAEDCNAGEKRQREASKRLDQSQREKSSALIASQKQWVGQYKSASWLDRPLLDKVTMVSPNLLQDAGVPVFKIVQQPGEFVVTFPLAYHSGFSTGFNVAEAINFATASWLPYGIRSLARYRALGRESVIDMEKMLLQTISHSELHTISTTHARMVLLLVQWVHAVLAVAREHKIKWEVLTRNQRRPEEQSDRADGRILCCHCGHTMYLCYLTSSNNRHLHACPEHVAALGKVEVGSLKVTTRLTRTNFDHLTGICNRVLARCRGQGLDSCKGSIVTGLAGEVLLDLKRCQPLGAAGSCDRQIGQEAAGSLVESEKPSSRHGGGVALENDNTKQTGKATVSFLAICWECKRGKFARQHCTKKKCRLEFKHIECDWNKDPREGGSAGGDVGNALPQQDPGLTAPVKRGSGCPRQTLDTSGHGSGGLGHAAVQKVGKRIEGNGVCLSLSGIEKACASCEGEMQVKQKRGRGRPRKNERGRGRPRKNDMSSRAEGEAGGLDLRGRVGTDLAGKGQDKVSYATSWSRVEHNEVVDRPSKIKRGAGAGGRGVSGLGRDGKDSAHAGHKDGRRMEEGKWRTNGDVATSFDLKFPVSPLFLASSC